MTPHQTSGTSEAIEALAGAVRSAQKEDPFAGVVVLAAGRTQALALERALARKIEGVLNVRTSTPEDWLKEALGAAARIPADSDLAAWAEQFTATLRSEISDPKHPYAQALDAPGFPRLLLSSLAELRQGQVTADALKKAAQDLVPAQWAARAMQDLNRAVREQGKAFLEDLAITDLGKLQPPAAMILYALDPLPQYLETALAALAARGVRLERISCSPPPDAALAARVELAPCASLATECEEVVRRVRDWAASGIPFHDIAVAVPNWSSYEAALRSAFDSAGIPTYAGGEETLDRSRAGRAAFALLNVLARGFHRDAVLDLLDLAPPSKEFLEPCLGAPPGDDEMVSAARIGRLSAQAFILRGPDSWKLKLEEFAERLRKAIAAAAADEEGEKNEHSGDARNLAAVDVLLRWLPPYLRRVAGVGEAATLAEAGERLASFLNDVAGPLHGADQRPTTPGVAKAVREGLRGAGQPMDLMRLSARLRRLLSERRRGEPEKFGRGSVWLASPEALVGIPLRATAFMGLQEGLLPPRLREDPLLPDEIKERLGIGGTRKDRSAEIERVFRCVLNGAGERLLLTWPSRQGEGKGKAHPSSYLNRFLGAGIPKERPIFVRSTDLTPIHSVSAAQAGFFQTRGKSASALRDLACATAPTIARAGEAEEARWERKELSEWDALVRDPQALEALAARLNPISPSRFATLLACPRRFLLDHLGVREQVPLGEDPGLSRMDRGTILHAILERLLGRHLGKVLADAEPSLRAGIGDICLSVFNEAEKGGTAPFPLAEGRASDPVGPFFTGAKALWLLEQNTLRTMAQRILDLLLGDDFRSRRILAVEAKFGMDGIAAVALGAGAWSLRGQIDLVLKVAESGDLAVFDYKSGSPKGYEADVVVSTAGEVQAQMPVYTIAARELYHANVLATGYLFPNLEGNSATLKPVTTAVVPAFAAATGRILDEISMKGVYPAYGSGEGKNSEIVDRADLLTCKHCASHMVCATARLIFIQKSESIRPLACHETRKRFEQDAADLAQKREQEKQEKKEKKT